MFNNRKIMILESQLRVLREDMEKLNKYNADLYREKEEIKAKKAIELLEEYNIDDFFKFIQTVAKERIKKEDDVYKVDYYVELYKFIEDKLRGWR